jgi:hypothetical protein
LVTDEHGEKQTLCDGGRLTGSSLKVASRPPKPGGRSHGQEMPQGYYSIEQWTPSANNDQGAWTVVLQLPFGTTLTAAEGALERLGQPGFYRIVQMQRIIWAEEQEGALKLRKSHASSPANLQKMVEMFERSGGRYPLEEVRAARRLSKLKKGS